jgi:lipoprotein Spr
MSQSGTDCSGLTYQLYKAVYKKTLRRSSADMAKYDVKDLTKSALKPGDLIFFATSGNTKAITHVGVYLKDNRFIHASSKAGVVVNNLNEDYYRKTFVKCGRVE